MSTAALGLDVRRAVNRDKTAISWLDSAHSFSFGNHYDPDNTHFGMLLVNNDDRVAPGTGFETHPHRDMEIITWVLSGQLVHQDSEGHNGLIHPGLAQRMSAGTGILHSEKNDSGTTTGTIKTPETVHFVQMWIVPDTPGIAPGYEQLDVTPELERGGLVPVASGMPRHAGAAAIRIANKYSALHAGRLAAGDTVSLPDSPYAHVFVARGSLDLEGAGRLSEGDAVRVTGAQGQRLTAAGGPAEVLIWEMHAAVA
jgi:redox-sensitive bicupin YhaK (pirin superfamily)